MSLLLRRATADDAPAYARIMGDPQVFPGTLQLPHANVQRWRDLLAEAAQPGKIDLNLVAESGGQVLGTAGVHPVGPQLRRRHAMMLGIAVAPAAQGQGVGQALMAELLRYTDGWAQVLRVELTVYADNDRAIRLYQRHGFEVEGRLRGYALRHGEYADVLAMARWHPHPPTLAARPEPT
jgi:putative acetyltransferase